MTDNHVHVPAAGLPIKVKNIIVTRVEIDGKPGYRVESVANSVDYWPPQILEVSEVAKLCEDNSWQVGIIAPPRNPAFG